MTRATIALLCLIIAACKTPRENGSYMPVNDVPADTEELTTPKEAFPNDAPFDRFAFRWLQNAVYDRPITKDHPLTAAEMNEHFSHYRCMMPTYAEWSPPFDINRDGMIDIDEYERAKGLYEQYYKD